MPILKRTAHRVRDLGPSPDDRAVEAVASWIAGKASRRAAFVEGLAERYAAKPSLNELRVAERLLKGKAERKALTGMYDALHEARPELLYPLMPRLRFLLTKDQPRALRAQLEAALASTDTTGVDFDPLIEAGLKLTTSEQLRHAVAFVEQRRHGAAPDSPMGRVPDLVAALDTDDWIPKVERVDPCTRGPDDVLRRRGDAAPRAGDPAPRR